MRTGFAARATEVAAADRNAGLNTSRALLARVASCLIGLLLVLQLAGLSHQSVRVAVSPDAKSVALAGLGAAIGQPVTLCDHGDGPARPGDPGDRGGCEHCIFCHSVAVGVVIAPVVATGVARVATATAVERPRADLAPVRARHLDGATPRGPPTFG